MDRQALLDAARASGVSKSALESFGSSTDDVMAHLADRLLSVAHALDTAAHVRPILCELLSIGMEARLLQATHAGASRSDKLETLQSAFIALGLHLRDLPAGLAASSPVVLLAVQFLERVSVCPIESLIPSSVLQAEQNVDDNTANAITERSLAAAAFAFADVVTSALPIDQVYRSFNWACVVDLLKSADADTRAFAARTLVLLEGADHDTAAHFLCGADANDVAIPNTSSVTSRLHAVITHDGAASSITSKADTAATVMSREGGLYHQHQAVVCGVPLRRPRGNANSATTTTPTFSHSQFVYTATTESNLQRVAQAIAHGRPVLVQGPPGCGKTSVIHELARCAGMRADQVVDLQIDDQMDSKTLLGTYVCTDTPGEFVWQAGALTRAVQAGHWVLIEDIDRVPFEVLAALVPLFESRRLLLPNRNQVIVAAPGFQLIATRATSAAAMDHLTAKKPNNVEESLVEHDMETTAESKTTPCGSLPVLSVEAHNAMRLTGAAASMLKSLWTSVPVFAMTAGELVRCACALFTDLQVTMVHRITETFQVLRDAQARGTGIQISNDGDARINLRSALPGRSFSERDFFKWLRRTSTLSHLSSQSGNLGVFTERERYAVLAEALDCFAAGMPKPEHRTAVATWIASRWELSPERVAASLTAYVPGLIDSAEEDGTAKLGRAVVVKRGMEIATRQGVATKMAAFAPAGPTMRVMEQVAVCVQMNEPVLLVGETGVGKTAIVQLLASLGRRKLVVHNMHMQSDSAELLGGYKPLEMSQVARPLYNELVGLFTNTFSKTANVKFLEVLEKAYEKNNWKRLSRGFARAIKQAEAKLGVLDLVSTTDTDTAPTSNEEDDDATNNKQMNTNTTDDNDNKSNKKKKRSKGKKKGGARTASAAAEQDQESAPVSKLSRTESTTDNKINNNEQELSDISDAKHEQRNLRKAWSTFKDQSSKFERQRVQCESAFAFSFMEGALIKAVRDGDWVFLDEINLASSETLERLIPLLDGHQGSIALTERGDTERVVRHPDFRLFAAMNPATDFGKKDLPPALRNRFSEMYVDEIVDPSDLQRVAVQYFGDVPGVPLEAIVNVYLQSRALAEKKLADGAQQPPRYTLRTLTRALSSARLFLAKGFGAQRALYEGFCMAFVTLLEPRSAALLHALINNAFVPTLSQKQLDAPRRRPGPKLDKDDWVLCETYWLSRGPLDVEDWANPAKPLPGKVDQTIKAPSFVLTPTVTGYVRALARAASAARFPILLQGPTSSGKTTMVGYLAARTGHRCVRINNHEHTDLQEYMGSYVSDQAGKLVFQEGVLVEAVRKGYWIVLDELNLAPSEVLEALNRLLDDNRELFIPETQETVRPHPHFMLFATQNPPGAYGGRKVLSRAFRNRFLELHVDEIPSKELETILAQRCKLAPPFCRVLVNVMKDLQVVRAKSRVFAGKDGFITPRDLLRWAQRGPLTYQSLAEEGYRLLGERVRVDAEKQVVRSIIEKHCKTTIDESVMYSFDTLPNTLSSAMRESLIDAGTTKSIVDADGGHSSAASAGVGRIVWTKAMCRLYTLIGRCLETKEPVLLVGETGCGKTTVCQVHALVARQCLDVLNCHQNTETADILGSLRPVRNREVNAGRMYALAHAFFANARAHVAAATVDEEETSKASLSAVVPSEEEVPSATPAEIARWVEECVAKLNAEVVASADDNDATMDTNTDTSKEEDSKGTTFLGAYQATATELLALCRQQQSLFEWQDGPLVRAMRQGDFMLLDELSLAEDAVIERLNSVLEPSRTLVLAEKGGGTVDEVVAHKEFRIAATMNPGGDFGKRELSPALRNRFTEIWIPAIKDADDQMAIVRDFFNGCARLDRFGQPLVDFIQWFNTPAPGHMTSVVALSLRDLLSWAQFVRTTVENDVLTPWEAFVHGAGLIVLDGLGLGTGASTHNTRGLQKRSWAFLREQVPKEHSAQAFALIDSAHFSTTTTDRETNGDTAMVALDDSNDVATDADTHAQGVFGLPPFVIPRGPLPLPDNLNFAMSAPTTSKNLMRVLRAMQLSRPILLEGSPGVGKTSLISALAAASGHKLVRINLSEQTELADLMGSDLPMPTTDGDDDDENKNAVTQAKFQWCDGVFLSALQAGHWVLLDELNLAPQPVLEGLNACLDHRATVYIPELDRSFACPPSFRVFAAQNPLQQGGGRKGLPKSFLNRFTKVFVDSLDTQDLTFITKAAYPKLAVPPTLRDSTPVPPSALIAISTTTQASLEDQSQSILELLVAFNEGVVQDTMTAPKFARQGSPWEFNLRDIFRWCELMVTECSAAVGFDPAVYVDLLYVQRMRTHTDRVIMQQHYARALGQSEQQVELAQSPPQVIVTSTRVSIGYAHLARSTSTSEGGAAAAASTGAAAAAAVRGFPMGLLSPTMHVAKCVQHALPVLLVGPSGSGKTAVIRYLAALCNRRVFEFGMTTSTDSSDLLGCFEQSDAGRSTYAVLDAADLLASQVTAVCMARYITSANNNNNNSDENEDGDMATATLRGLQHARHVLAKHRGRGVLDHNTSVQYPTAAINTCLTAVQKALKHISSADGSIDNDVNDAGVSECHDNFQELLDTHHTLSAQYESGNGPARGMFEWVDGSLLRAMEHGHWVVLNNANLCNPTVLDRLNAVMERGGELLINECGMVDGKPRIVRPHADFRIFLVVDPQHGDVSRAMRNRCVEIALLLPTSSATTTLAVKNTPKFNTSNDAASADLARMLVAQGVRDSNVIALMLQVHAHVSTPGGGGSRLSKADIPGTRVLLSWGRSVATQLQDGVASLDALSAGFVTCYGPYGLVDPQGSAADLKTWLLARRAGQISDFVGRLEATLPTGLDGATCLDPDTRIVIRAAWPLWQAMEDGLPLVTSNFAHDMLVLAPRETTSKHDLLVDVEDNYSTTLASVLGGITSRQDGNDDPSELDMSCLWEEGNVGRVLMHALVAALQLQSSTSASSFAQWLANLERMTVENTKRDDHYVGRVQMIARVLLRVLRESTLLSGDNPNSTGGVLEACFAVQHQIHDIVSRANLISQPALGKQVSLSDAHAREVGEMTLHALLLAADGDVLQEGEYRLMWAQWRALSDAAAMWLELKVTRVLESTSMSDEYPQVLGALRVSHDLARGVTSGMPISDDPLCDMLWPFLTAGGDAIADALFAKDMGLTLAIQNPAAYSELLEAGADTWRCRQHLWASLANMPATAARLDRSELAVRTRWFTKALARMAACVVEPLDNVQLASRNQWTHLFALTKQMERHVSSAIAGPLECFLDASAMMVTSASTSLSSRTTSLLWKRNGHPRAFKSQAAIDEFAILAHSVKRACWHLESTSDSNTALDLIQALSETHPALFLSDVERRELVHLWCTLEWANAQATDSKPMLPDVAAIVSAWENKLQAARTQGLSSHEAKNQWAQAQLLPVMDLSVALAESQLIGDLCTASVVVANTQGKTDTAMTVHTLTKLAARTKAFVNRAMQSLSRDTVSVAPYQQASWVLESVSADPTEARVATVRAELGRLVPALVRAWHQSTWRAAFNRCVTVGFSLQTMNHRRKGAAGEESSASMNRNDSLAESWSGPLSGSGPARLFQDTAVGFTVRLVHGTGLGIDAGAPMALPRSLCAGPVSLEDRSAKMGQLASLLEQLSATQGADATAQRSAECQAVCALTYSTFECLLKKPTSVTAKPEHEQDVTAALAALASTSSFGTHHADVLVAALTESLSSNLDRVVFEACVPPLLHELVSLVSICNLTSDMHESQDGWEHALEVLSTLGQCWMLLGRARLALLMPGSAVDPAHKQTLRCDILLRNMHENHLVSASRRLRERINADASDGRLAVMEKATRAKHQEQLVVLRERVVVRQVDASFVDMYTELDNFMSTGFGSQERIHAMVSVLSSSKAMMASKKKRGNKKARAKVEAALREEQVWQMSTERFVSVLRETYWSYADVVEPVAAAVLHIKHGVRLLAHATAARLHGQGGIGAQLKHELVAFPRFDAPFEALLNTDTMRFVGDSGAHAHAATSARTSLLLTALHRARVAEADRNSSIGGGGGDAEGGDVLGRVFDAFVVQWDKEQAVLKAKREEDAKQVVFKNVANPEEREEADFRAMFPDYYEHFEKGLEDVAEAAALRLRMREAAADRDDGNMSDADDNNATASNNNNEAMDQGDNDSNEDDDEEEEEDEDEGKGLEGISVSSSHVVQAVVHGFMESTSGVSSSSSSSISSSGASTGMRKQAFACAMQSVAHLSLSSPSLTPVASAGSRDTTAGGLVLALADAVAQGNGLPGSSNIFTTMITTSSNAAVSAAAAQAASGVKKKAIRKRRGRRHKTKVVERAPNPYHEADIAELTVLTKPLTAFKTRVEVLMAEWPDNAVLVQILVLVDRLFALPLSSPLMKALVGVETLMRKAQEWEVSAHKALKITDELNGLGRLVLRWRKVEVQSFSSLLEQRHIASMQDAYGWWFNLYQLAVLGRSQYVPRYHAGSETGSSRWLFMSEEEAIKIMIDDASGIAKKDKKDQKKNKDNKVKDVDYSRDLFAAVDQYLRTATLGDFGARLALVRALASFLERRLDSNQPQQQQQGYVPEARPLVSILVHLCAYYDQWSEQVETSLGALRAPMEKKLSDHAKLAKWDDRNYFALKDSAERSHRQMFKITRGYDEVLDMPIQHAITMAIEKGIAPPPAPVAAPKSDNEDAVDENGNPAKKEPPVPVVLVLFDDIPSAGSDESAFDMRSRTMATGLKKRNKSRADDPSLQLLEPTLWSETLASRTQTLRFLPRAHELTARLSRRCVRRLVPGLVTLREDAQAPSDLSAAIVSRIKSLQVGRAPHSAKQRAFVDLLKGMKAQGLSRHSGTVPTDFRDLHAVMELPRAGPLVGRALKKYQSDHQSDLWLHADGMFNRCIAQLQQLRQTAAGVHATDVTEHQVRHSVGYAENLLLALAQERVVLHDSAAELMALSSASKALADVCQDVEVLVSSVANSTASTTVVEMVDEEENALLSLKLRCENGLLGRVGELGRALHCAHVGLAEFTVLVESTDKAAQSCKNNNSDNNARPLSAFARDQLAQAATELDRARQTLAPVIAVASDGGENGASRPVTQHEWTLVKQTVDLVRAADERMTSSLASERDICAVPNAVMDAVVAYVNDATAAAEACVVAPAASALASGKLKSSPPDESLVDEVCTSADTALEQLLVCVQNVMSVLSTTTTTKSNNNHGVTLTSKDDVDMDGADDAGNTDDLTPQGLQRFHDTSIVKCAESARVSALASAVWPLVRAIRRGVSVLAHSSEGLVNADLKAAVGAASALRGPLANVVDVLWEWMLGSVEYHHDACRLELLLIRVFRTVLANGFCKAPAEEEDDDEDGSGSEGEGDGTGMGSGEGKDDVTDQLENEEQLLGLKGDEHQEKETEGEEKGDDGMEMENDFEGDMYDVEKEQEEQSDDEKDDKEKEKDEEELDREVGDERNENEQVVDEKLWGEDSDDEEEDPTKDESFEEDRPMDGDNMEDEMRTKDDDDDGKQDQSKQEEEKTGKDEKKEEDKQDEGGNDDEEEEEGGDNKEKDESEMVNDEEKEEANLNVPDKLDLGQDDEEDEDNKEEEGGDDLKEQKGDNDGDSVEGAEKEEETAEAGEEEEEENVVDKDEEDGDKEDEDKDAPGGDPMDVDDNKAPEQDEENPEDTENEEEEENDQLAPSSTEAGTNDDENNKNDEDKEGEEEDEEEEEEDNQEKHEPPVASDPLASQDEDQGAEADPDQQLNSNSGTQPQGSKDDEEEQDKQASKPDAQAKQQEQDNNEDRDGDADGQQGQEEDDPSGAGTWRKTAPDQSNKDDEDNDDVPESSNQQKPPEMSKDAPNPWLSPGDVTKHWHRRLNLQPPETENDEPSAEDGGEEEDEGEGAVGAPMDEELDDGSQDQPAGTFDLSKGQDESTTQMLGPMAQEDQAQVPEIPDVDNLDDAPKTMDEDMLDTNNKEEEDKQDVTEEDGDEDGDEKNDENEDDALAAPSRKRKQREPKTEDDVDSEEEDEDEPDNKKAAPDVTHNDDGEKEEVDERDPVMTDGEALRELRATLRDSMEEDEKVKDAMVLRSQDNEDDGDDDGTGALVPALDMDEALQRWAQLTGETSDLSQRLCEQLRLLLDPTLASKLRGDYRTGKRINLRKVIPYIASQYKKDKIWLRRTKPSKRQYQVVIAIDDSKSMEASGDLALQALATISRALTKLEVGELGVVRFGETVEFVHPLDQPFTDASGADVVSHFTFQQERTCIEEGLQKIVETLDEARRAPQGGQSVHVEFKQLVFFVSDGRFDSGMRDRMQRWIRLAMRNKLLLVLLIVEPPGQESILKTKQVTYPNGKLKISSYMDEYPFPYYVILSGTQALPETLADALRQWFELMAGGGE